jgi:hypothetical protein
MGYYFTYSTITNRENEKVGLAEIILEGEGEDEVEVEDKGEIEAEAEVKLEDEGH